MNHGSGPWLSEPASVEVLFAKLAESDIHHTRDCLHYLSIESTEAPREIFLGVRWVLGR